MGAGQAHTPLKRDNNNKVLHWGNWVAPPALQLVLLEGEQCRIKQLNKAKLTGKKYKSRERDIKCKSQQAGGGGGGGKPVLQHPSSTSTKTTLHETI